MPDHMGSYFTPLVITTSFLTETFICHFETEPYPTYIATRQYESFTTKLSMDCAALSNLPTEVLQAICAQLCTHCTPEVEFGDARRFANITWELQRLTRGCMNTHALIYLSQTCRRFHQIVKPFIYHDFVTEPWRLCQIRDFLRTVCRNPDLATLIRRLAIHKDVFSPGDHWLLIKDEATRRGISRAREWDPPINDDTLHTGAERYSCLFSAEILIALLLSTFINVEYLYLETRTGARNGRLIPPWTNRPSLKVLHLATGTSGIEPLDFELLESLFERAPNLESLQVSIGFGPCPWLPMGARASPLLLAGNLRWLKFKDTIPLLEDLQDLATACPKLETFVFHTSIRDDGRGNMFRPRLLAQGLLPCKNTLRHIEIECSWEPIVRRSLDPFIDSLKEFTSLECLVLSGTCASFTDFTQWVRSESDEEHTKPSCDAYCLIKLLPASIRTVVLDKVCHNLVKPILALAQEVAKGSFPYLTSFEMTGLRLRHLRKYEFLKETMGDVGVLFGTDDLEIFSQEYGKVIF